MMVRICDWRGTEISRETIDLPEIGDGYEFSKLPVAQAAADEAKTRGERIKIFAGPNEGEISPHTPRRVDGTPHIRWHFDE